MLRTFETEQELYDAFKAICVKERENVGAKLNELIKEYIKIHGDGNPQFSIEQFQDPDFSAAPAFYRPGDDWKSWLIKQDSKEHDKVKAQILLIEKKLLEVTK